MKIAFPCSLNCFLFDVFLSIINQIFDPHWETKLHILMFICYMKVELMFVNIIFQKKTGKIVPLIDKSKYYS